ncbi:APC family permease [bacterium]|nr:APC family permease [bacterium]
MTSPHLKRELGLFDLTLLLVVAVVNVNILPRIAGEGWRSMTLWLLAFVLFLIPCGIAVAQFGKRFPGEGGIYIWTREMFGDFHAFISGWCYWTNNLFYFPSVLFILVGVLVYAGGTDSASLAEGSNFIAIASLSFLWLITFLHIRGLGVGKWLNNIGAFGTWITFVILLIAGFLMLRRNGVAATPFELRALVPSFTDYGGFSALSIVMYSLVGLELGSVMGDEIKNPEAMVGRAAFWGGTISILLYMIGTAALLIAMPSSEVGAIQGMMQAVTTVASALGASGIIPFVAILISTAVLGICSAWMSGAARIPFVMGLSVYLPPALGKTHPRWNTPYIALLVQAVISSCLILLSLYGTNVREAYEKLLSSSVVIQLIPFLYLFAGLWKLETNRVWAALGFVATALGAILVFVPSSGVENPTRFLLEVSVSLVVMIGLAVLLYFWGSRKAK